MVMKIAITHKNTFTSKKNQLEYTMFSGISTSGKVVSFFLNNQQLKEYGFENFPIPSKERLEEVLDNLPMADVNFDNSGFLDSASVV